MNRSVNPVTLAFAILVLSYGGRAQADYICREIGETPTREIGRENRLAPYIFGRVSVKGAKKDAKPPRLTVIYSVHRNSWHNIFFAR